MNLLLLSWGLGALPDFLASAVPAAGAPLRIGYVDDAAAAHEGEPWVAVERKRLAATGHALIDLRAGVTEPQARSEMLDSLDAVYVAGGNTFALMVALRRTGAAEDLTRRVRAGLPYIGLSAGAIVTGPSLEPLTLMDDPAEAPALDDLSGLGLVDTVVVPHADGALPPYPPELIEQIRATYEEHHDLTFLRDDQALVLSGGELRRILSP